ncbi:hypothetical protein QR680_008123 [Steinernema hermaphroditum]|uniref:Uncharacterized protein n=1 Tax=Steinernema hermaphroditum TaxID=289476 RepID=A0AA39M7J1_9BILA|nr:hypothetical protein QR680_008123 [Steinernema hermaphroditum]
MGSVSSTSRNASDALEQHSATKLHASPIPSAVLDSDQVLLAASAQRGEFKEEEMTTNSSVPFVDPKPSAAFNRKWF